MEKNSITNKCSFGLYRRLLASLYIILKFLLDYTLSLDFSEKVNFSRSSIDVTFETEAYHSGLVGLLLSGASGDDTDGLKAVRRSGTAGLKVYRQLRCLCLCKQSPVTLDRKIDADDVGDCINFLQNIAREF